MTDRYPGFLVTLDRDVREDDAEAFLTAIRMIKGVVNVEPLVTDYLGELIARNRERQWWVEQLHDLTERSRRKSE